MHNKNFLLIPVILILTSFLTGDTFINSIKKKIISVSPFKCLFVSRVFDENELVVEEKGHIIYVDNSNIRWVYNEPEYKVWVLKKNRYEFYEREENQLTKGVIRNKENIWIWKIFNIDESSKNILVSKKRNIIKYSDRENGSEYEISFGRDHLPKKVIQNDPSGVRIEYTFLKYFFRIHKKGKDLSIKIPKDTDIVELN